MSAEYPSKPKFISSPISLQYLRLVRTPVFLEYIRSIHEDIGLNLEVWKIRNIISDEKRVQFKALCSARLWLISMMPVVYIILINTFLSILGFQIDWFISLLFVASFMLGMIINDMICWFLGNKASFVLSGMSLYFHIILLLPFAIEIVFTMEAYYRFYDFIYQIELFLFDVDRYLRPYNLLQLIYSSSLSVSSKTIIFGAIVGLLWNASRIGACVAIGATIGLTGEIIGSITWAAAFGLFSLFGFIAISILTSLLSEGSRGALKGVAETIPYSAAFGLAGGILTSYFNAPAEGTIWGAMIGASMGQVWVVFEDTPTPYSRGAFWGYTLGVPLVIAGTVLIGIIFGTPQFVIIGFPIDVRMCLIFGTSAMLAYSMKFTRAPLLFWEFLWSWWIGTIASRQLNRTQSLWHRQPLYFDEFAMFRLPGVPKHIAALGHTNHLACLHAIEDVHKLKRQRPSVRIALQLIIKHELSRCSSASLIAEFHRRTDWIPRDRFLVSDLLLLEELRSISAIVSESLNTSRIQQRIWLLRAQVERLQRMCNELENNRLSHVRAYKKGLRYWQDILRRDVDTITSQLIKHDDSKRLRIVEALNDFDHLYSAQEDIFLKIKEFLEGTQQFAVIIGQPGVGKSYLINQLSGLLEPHVFVVHFRVKDLINKLSDIEILEAVSEAIHNSLKHSTDINPINVGLLRYAPYQVFLTWLTRVDTTLQSAHQLLIVFDDFEYIHLAIRQGHVQEQMLSLFNNINNFYPHIRLIMCGRLEPSQYGAVWDKVFSNTIILQLRCPSIQDASRFLVESGPAFRPHVYTEEALRKALELSGGHPQLLRLLHENIVDIHNTLHGKTIQDTEPINLEQVTLAASLLIEDRDDIFRPFWNWALRISGKPYIAARLLRSLAFEEPIDNVGTVEQRAQLAQLFCRWELLKPNDSGSYGFYIPLMARWIKDKKSSPDIVEYAI